MKTKFKQKDYIICRSMIYDHYIAEETFAQLEESGIMPEDIGGSGRKYAIGNFAKDVAQNAYAEAMRVELVDVLNSVLETPEKRRDEYIQSLITDINGNKKRGEL